jgi:hypothetical protein
LSGRSGLSHVGANGLTLVGASTLLLGGAMGLLRVGATTRVGAIGSRIGPVMMLTPSHRYDVTRDGQRFVIATRDGEQRTTPLSVIVNWQQGLGR